MQMQNTLIWSKNETLGFFILNKDLILRTYNVKKKKP